MSAYPPRLVDIPDRAKRFVVRMNQDAHPIGGSTDSLWASGRVNPSAADRKIELQSALDGIVARNNQEVLDQERGAFKENLWPIPKDPSAGSPSPVPAPSANKQNADLATGDSQNSLLGNDTVVLTAQNLGTIVDTAVSRALHVYKKFGLSRNQRLAFAAPANAETQDDTASAPTISCPPPPSFSAYCHLGNRDASGSEQQSLDSDEKSAVTTDHEEHKSQNELPADTDKHSPPQQPAAQDSAFSRAVRVAVESWSHGGRSPRRQVTTPSTRKPWNSPLRASRPRTAPHTQPPPRTRHSRVRTPGVQSPLRSGVSRALRSRRSPARGRHQHTGTSPAPRTSGSRVHVSHSSGIPGSPSCMSPSRRKQHVHTADLQHSPPAPPVTDPNNVGVAEVAQISGQCVDGQYAAVRAVDAYIASGQMETGPHAVSQSVGSPGQPAGGGSKIDSDNQASKTSTTSPLTRSKYLGIPSFEQHMASREQPDPPAPPILIAARSTAHQRAHRRHDRVKPAPVVQQVRNSVQDLQFHIDTLLAKADVLTAEFSQCDQDAQRVQRRWRSVTERDWWNQYHRLEKICKTQSHDINQLQRALEHADPASPRRPQRSANPQRPRKSHRRETRHTSPKSYPAWNPPSPRRYTFAEHARRQRAAQALKRKPQQSSHSAPHAHMDTELDTGGDSLSARQASWMAEDSRPRRASRRGDALRPSTHTQRDAAPLSARSTATQFSVRSASSSAGSHGPVGSSRGNSSRTTSSRTSGGSSRKHRSSRGPESSSRHAYVLGEYSAPKRRMQRGSHNPKTAVRRSGRRGGSPLASTSQPVRSHRTVGAQHSAPSGFSGPSGLTDSEHRLEASDATERSSDRLVVSDAKETGNVLANSVGSVSPSASQNEDQGVTGEESRDSSHPIGTVQSFEPAPPPASQENTTATASSQRGKQNVNSPSSPGRRRADVRDGSQDPIATAEEAIRQALQHLHK